MSYINLESFLFVTPFILFFKLTLEFFFKVNTFLNLKVFCKDKLRYSGDLKKNFFQSYININLVIIFFSLLNCFLLKGWSIEFFFGNLVINNFNINVIVLVYLITINLLVFFKNIFLQKVNYTNDYFFSVINLVIFIPFIFFTNNVYSFIFFLEFLSILVFYKLSTSKSNSVDFFKKKKNFFFSKKYINMLFYQFWVTFFSTIFLFFFLNNVLLMLGTSNFFLVNYITLSSFFLNFFEKINLLLVSIFFFLFFFIKMGVAPLHIFKIEIYESIPYISILFYTTFYISVFLIFLTYFISNLCSSLFFLSNIFLFFIVIFGFVYVIGLIFNIQFLKSFLAYSTVLNLLSFLSILVLVML